MPDQIKNEQIENNFTYHPPFGTQGVRYGEIRTAAKTLAYLFEFHCPNSRERSLAMTKLEESVMWANAAIARNEEKTEAEDPPPPLTAWELEQKFT